MICIHRSLASLRSGESDVRAALQLAVTVAIVAVLILMLLAVLDTVVM